MTSWCLEVTAAAYVTQDKRFDSDTLSQKVCIWSWLDYRFICIRSISTGYALGHRLYSVQQMTTQQRISLVHKTEFYVFIVLIIVYKGDFYSIPYFDLSIISLLNQIHLHQTIRSLLQGETAQA